MREEEIFIKRERRKNKIKRESYTLVIKGFKKIPKNEMVKTFFSF